jgi:ABC-type branched-subunit amino acid transport system ATPase component
MSLLRVEQLGVRYGRVAAVQDVSLALEPGRVLAILGRNGAGKSSLLNAIAGLVRPSQGRIFWRERDISRESAARRVQTGIALVPEGRRIFPELTIRENLRLGGFRLAAHDFAGQADRVLGLFPVLAGRYDEPAGRLSGGQQQMLAVGRALMSGASLLLLDEPSLGLAPLVVDELYDQLQGLVEQGQTIILVEQHVHRALRFADQAIVLNLGRVVLSEAPQVLANDPRLVATYMGEVPA